MSDEVRLVVGGPVAEIVLDRPAKKNALNAAMWAVIPGLVERAVADDAVRVIIIHGGAAGAFAAGADISEFGGIYGDEASAMRAADQVAGALAAIEACPKPTLAAIEGPCVGGGVSIAIACDLRVASAGATFGVTPAKLGLAYPFDDVRRLRDLVGGAAARDILFTARLFGAEEALRLRLVDRIAPQGEAFAAAQALAGDISALSQWSMRANKALLRRAEGGLRTEDEAARAMFLASHRGADFAEGVAAFLAKRPAGFPWR